MAGNLLYRQFLIIQKGRYMTAFDDRDKGFENKFAHDEELTFKATALCNRMLGLWAAEKMGKVASDRDEPCYGREGVKKIGT